jgi:ADP-heptose:LPS heptosyltransferase|tara:strand:+ start:2642 stop:3346 length:705 start_codon:yes stop_codon:yes gene_type:complete
LQRFLSTGLITALSKAPVKIGFTQNPMSRWFTHKTKYSVSNGMHEVERNLQLIQPISDIVIKRPKIYLSQVHYKKVKKYQDQAYLCIAPSSVWFTKMLPKENWVAFLNKNLEIKIYLIGSEQDRGLNDWIISRSNNRSAESLAGHLTLLESAALMGSAKMNYVNDSAPMHLASAINAPTTAIFCSTIPDFGFGPLSDNQKIIQTDKKLACRPCGLHGKMACPKGHFDCSKLFLG